MPEPRPGRIGTEDGEAPSPFRGLPRRGRQPIPAQAPPKPGSPPPSPTINPYTVPLPGKRGG